MPDLRDKHKAKARAQKQSHKHNKGSGSNQHQNTRVVDSAELSGDVARDISNEGVMREPQDNPYRSNP